METRPFSNLRKKLDQSRFYKVIVARCCMMILCRPPHLLHCRFLPGEEAISTQREISQKENTTVRQCFFFFITALSPSLPFAVKNY